MNHLPRDAEILAARLAEVRGISPDEAVVVALKETLERTPAKPQEKPKQTGDDLLRQIEEISARYRARPLLDPRSPEEILGYDEFGLPR